MAVFTFMPRASAAVAAVGQGLARRVPEAVAVHRISEDGPPLPLRFSLEVDGGIARALQLVKAVLADMPDEMPVVLASGPGFQSFVAGYFLKRLLGLRLVLDYRDEWSECPFDFVQHGQLNAWWERRCLHACDLAVFTTPPMRDHALGCFPFLDVQKTCVVENGAEFSEGRYEGRSTVVSSMEEFMGDGRGITICFLGGLGAHTDPSGFMSTLNVVLGRRADLRTLLRVFWIGNKGEAQADALTRLDDWGVSVSVPQVSQPEAREIMQRSSLLLLLVNRDMDRYRPGKLYEYLASETSILVYGSKGESGRIVEQLGAGSVVDGGAVDALERAIDGALDPRQRMAINSERRTWIESHDRAALARKLFGHLDRLVGAG